MVCALVGVATTLASPPRNVAATRGYIENKGQIGDQYGKPNHDVRFLVLRPGLNIQLRANGFSYDAFTNHSARAFHRIDVDLVGANPSPIITANGASADYLNFYTPVTQQSIGGKGATHVRGYATVTYHDVWPGIDIEWFLDAQERPEYQFVIHPGADPSVIAVQYRGANATQLLADAVVLHVDHGPIRETLPRSFVRESGRAIDVAYRSIASNTVGFAVPLSNLAMGETLVIDPLPQQTWGTYVGGDDKDGANAVAVTASGAMVITGQTWSTSGIATAGSHRTTIAEQDWDGFLTMLGADGQTVWSTYFGGDGWDVATAMTLTTGDDILLAGWTDSKNGIATEGSHKAMNDGTRDGFLNRFSATGERLWGTYVGGENWDVINGMTTDANGNIVVVGWTKSQRDVASEGAHQMVFGGSECDALVAKYSPNGERLWGTYLGGDGWDIANAVTTASNGDVVVVGWTESQHAIATDGSFQAVHGGTQDAFVARFTPDGVRAWATYVGGAGEDQANAVAVAATGEIVVGGQTESTSGIATPNSHQSEQAGEGQTAFLAMFNAEGSRTWATYYGGESADMARAVTVHPSGDVIVAGATQSWTHIATEGSHQSAYGGGYWDGFVARFTRDGSRRWGTYLGGEGADVIRSAVVAASGDVVVAGDGGSPAMVGSSASGLKPNPSGETDAFVAVLKGDGTTSVQEDQRSALALVRITSITPNPATTAVTVGVQAEEAVRLEVVDLTGRIVATHNVAAGIAEVRISTHGWSSGRYTIRLGSTRDAANTAAQGLVVVP
jgi:hypothetical protein